MGPRTFRNLLKLTGEAEILIRQAGRVPPAREVMMAALLPHAKVVTRAARHLEAAERQLAEAQALARESARSAVMMAEAVASICIETAPAGGARTVPFDPAKFIVALAPVADPARTLTQRAGELG